MSEEINAKSVEEQDVTEEETVTETARKPAPRAKSIEEIREEETRREEEKGSKRREIIKNIAIIFLAIMLVLTFFSNTIMNYTLPQVSSELISSGSIKSMLRGKGTIETIDPYNIKVKETRTVTAVNVKVGDTVQAGDVIYSLKGEESSELETQRTAVRTAETDYKSAIVTAELRADQVLQIEAGQDMNMNEIMNNIAEYDRQLDQYLTELDTLEAEKALLQLEVDQISGQKTVDNSGTVNALDKQIIICDKNIADCNAIIEAYRKKSEHTEEETQKYREAKAQLVKEEETKKNCEYQKSLAEVDSRVTVNGDVAARINDLNNQIKAKETTIALTTTAKKDTETRKETYVKSVSGKLTVLKAYDTLNDAKAKLEKLEKESLGKDITSPVNGKIVSLSKKAGEDTEPNEIVAVIQVEGKGYRTSFTVDASQARTVKVGDVVNVEDYFYNNVQVNLVAINPDTTDPQNKKNLVFELNGEGIEAGDTISLSVGNASASFNKTVPKSALRKDNKGDFILILQEKSVPFGTRYLAKRVEVSKIYAQDDARAAIEADVDDWGVYVISNSNKPIKGGDQVRLSEEQK